MAHQHSHHANGAGAPSGLGKMRSADSARITQSVALVAVGAAVLMIAIKFAAWLSTHSVAILSSLADSALDLAASLFTYFAVRYAAAPPDREHRFGHGKAEAFAGMFQAGLVAVSAVLVAIESIRRLFEPVAVENGLIAISAMAAATLITGLVVLVQTRALARTGSVATQGDRAHYFADFTSNIAVMVGAGAAAFTPFLQADAFVGLGASLWLGWQAWEVARNSADHLMDRELPDSDRDQIVALAAEDARILGVHDLRTRASGPYVHVQFHADLDPQISLLEAHEILVAAEARIRNAYPAADVIIHPDPMDAAEPHGHEFFKEGQGVAVR